MNTTSTHSSMANPISTIRHNVFKGLGEDLDVRTSIGSTWWAKQITKLSMLKKLRVFPTTLDGYASDWYA